MDAQTLADVMGNTLALSKYQEEWRPIPGYEGLYEVSSEGRVKSVARKTWFTNRWGDRIQRTVPEKVRELSPHRNGGHLYLTLHKDGKRKHWFAHHLVLLAFVGDWPEGCDEVRHLDGDPENNRVSNLAYGTHQENVDDMIKHGTHKNLRKTHCIRGHAFDGANTYYRRDGGRDCKACAKQRRGSSGHAAYSRQYREHERGEEDWMQ